MAVSAGALYKTFGQYEAAVDLYFALSAVYYFLSVILIWLYFNGFKSSLFGMGGLAVAMLLVEVLVAKTFAAEEVIKELVPLIFVAVLMFTNKEAWAKNA